MRWMVIFIPTRVLAKLLMLLSISPQHSLENIHVVWGLGERWFIEVKDEDNQGMIMTLQKDFISKVIRKNSLA